MRFYVVPIVSFICVGFDEWFLADFWVVLSVPLLYVGFTHRARVAVHVVAGRLVAARLRREGHAKFGHFESTLRTLKTVGFRRFATAVQAQVHRIPSVLEKCGMDVRPVAAVGPTQNPAPGHDARGWFVPAEHVVHAAYQMHQ